MSALRSILELFGTLDTAVARSNDPQVLETVNSLIPGDPANTGWFPELDAFMFPGGNTTDTTLGRVFDPPRAEADFALALVDIIDFAQASPDPEPLTIPEKARLAYGIAAANRLNAVVPGSVPGWIDDEDALNTLLIEAFQYAAPLVEGSSGPLADTREALGTSINEVRSLFAGLAGFEAWGGVARALADAGFIDPRAAHTLVESATVVPIDGIKSLIIDTEFESDDVTLNQVKAVVDPRNWHRNYPAFFEKMDPKGKRTDTWRKVVETVGVTAIPYSRRLRTHLKFFKSETTVAYKHAARLDYDLNDPVPDELGDKQIDVDRGYINMRGKGQTPDDPGVVVRTRKVAHIRGIRPETQARFAFIFGYTAGALDMMIGSATRPGRTEPPYYPWADKDDYPPDALQAAPPAGNTVASTAFKMAVKFAEDVTVRNLDLADKWLSGDLKIQDLADYSNEFGARLAGDPWKFLQAINQPKGGGS